MLSVTQLVTACDLQKSFIFTVQCCGSAVFAIVCLSVRLTVRPSCIGIVPQRFDIGT